jgi:hypothetical protein
VHYVKFVLTPTAVSALEGGTAGVKLGVDHPSYRAETVLGAATLKSLADDFA